MSRRIQFFARKEDILSAAARVESVGPVRYVKYGQIVGSDAPTYASIADIGDLGNAAYDSASACAKYLVYRPEVPFKLRPLKTLTAEDNERTYIEILDVQIPVKPGGLTQKVGKPRFAIDQLINPDCVVVNPGGIWNGNVLLRGELSTVSGTQISRDLFSRFSRAIKSQFTPMRSYYVGPGALEFLRAGNRLTQAVQCPRELDFVLE